jgi:hypothetical protein
MKKTYEKIKADIVKIYQRRQKAHDALLACDIEIDNLFKELCAPEKIIKVARKKRKITNPHEQHDK